MFENIERVSRLELLRHGSGKHIVDLALEAPLVFHALTNVFDEDGIEVDGDDARHFLADQACCESVATADLQGGALAGKHLRDELVARQKEGDAARIVMPALVAHQAKR